MKAYHVPLRSDQESTYQQDMNKSYISISMLNIQGSGKKGKLDW